MHFRMQLLSIYREHCVVIAYQNQWITSRIALGISRLIIGRKKTIVGSTLNTLLCHCHALYKIRKPNHLFFARKNCVHFVCGGTQTDHLIGPYSKTRLEIFIQPSQRAMHICSRVESFHVRRTIRFFFPMNCIQSPGSCLLRTSFPLSHFWAEMCSLACMLQCGWPFGILARLVVLFGLMMSRWSILSTIWMVVDDEKKLVGCCHIRNSFVVDKLNLFRRTAYYGLNLVYPV